MKKDGKKITMITAYSFPQAQCVDEAGIDIILVGDSLGMVELGYRDTVPVTMEEMLATRRRSCAGSKRAHVVGDMPFMSYNISREQAITNAGHPLQGRRLRLGEAGGRPGDGRRW